MGQLMKANDMLRDFQINGLDITELIGSCPKFQYGLAYVRHTV